MFFALNWSEVVLVGGPCELSSLILTGEVILVLEIECFLSSMLPFVHGNSS